MTQSEKKIMDFCLIQVQVLKEKQNRIRKELLDCKIQHEFFSSMIEELLGDEND